MPQAGQATRNLDSASGSLCLPRPSASPRAHTFPHRCDLWQDSRLSKGLGMSQTKLPLQAGWLANLAVNSDYSVTRSQPSRKPVRPLAQTVHGPVRSREHRRCFKSSEDDGGRPLTAGGTRCREGPLSSSPVLSLTVPDLD